MSSLTTNSQRSVRSRRPAGREGQPSGSLHNRAKTATNSDPQAPQISTLTATNYADGKTYNWEIDGVADSYTTVSGDTNVTGAAAKIVAKIKNNPAHRGLVVPTSAAGVVTLTSVYPGLAFTLVGGTDLAAATTQAAARGASMPMGRVVLATVSQPTISSNGYTERLANIGIRRALTGNVTARVLDITPTSANNTLFGLAVHLPNGRVINWPITSGGSASVAAIVTAQAAAIPAELTALGFAATDATTKLTVTGPVGLAFDIVPFGAGAQAVAVVTAGTDIEQQIAGITLIDELEVAEIAGTELVYPPEHPVGLMEDGEVLVGVSEAVTPADPVFVSCNSADAGRVYKTTAAGRAPVFRRLRWVRLAEEGSDDLAYLRVVAA